MTEENRRSRTLEISWEALEDAFENNAPEVHSYLHLAPGRCCASSTAWPTRRCTSASPATLQLPPRRPGLVAGAVPLDGALHRHGDRARPARRLVAAIDGKGAFRRFKDVLMSFPADRERWFSFAPSGCGRAWRPWLESHNLREAVARPVWTPPERTELLRYGMPDALHAEVSDASAWPVLETLLGEALAVREAERSSLASLSNLDPASVGALRARYRDEIVRRQRLEPGRGEAVIAELLRATGLSQSDFDTLLRRRLVARAYLEARHERLLSVGEVDLQRAVESGRYAAQCDVAEESRRCVRAELQWTALPNALRQYLRSLGGRVRVRIFTDRAP
jgi:hypothetical protein